MVTQRLSNEERGQPTVYYLVECFHKMIAGHVAYVDQGSSRRETFQLPSRQEISKSHLPSWKP